MKHVELQKCVLWSYETRITFSCDHSYICQKVHICRIICCFFLLMILYEQCCLWNSLFLYEANTVLFYEMYHTREWIWLGQPPLLWSKNKTAGRLATIKLERLTGWRKIKDRRSKETSMHAETNKSLSLICPCNISCFAWYLKRNWLFWQRQQ